MRLQKYIAQLGICSRRKAEELILAGKVFVNGKKASLGQTISPDKDELKISGVGNLKNQKEDKIYIALNKPAGYICSASDSQGKTVLDLIKNKKIGRVYPVGRLDKDSEGLVILTDDGELTNLLTHPRYEHEKEYEIILDRKLNVKDKAILEEGMDIGNGEFVRGIKIKKIIPKTKGCVVFATLTEGKNRQIRRMFGRLDYNLQRLKRIRVNKLRLGGLKRGQYKIVKKEDIL